MMDSEHQISQISRHSISDRRLQVEYGYVFDIISLEEQSYYIAVVGREQGIIPADEDSTVVPLEHSIEELTSLYGAPEDIIGLRVRVEYFGEDWRQGIAKIVSPREPSGVGTSMDVDSRGFRHAVAGGGNV